MEIKNVIIVTTILLGFYACSKPVGPVPSAVKGKWEIISEYRNDEYGGAFYWKSIPQNEMLQVEFSGDGKYYRNEVHNGRMTLLGSYTIKSPVAIRIVPADPGIAPFDLEWNIDDSRNLILTTGRTESVIKEKLRNISRQ
jgi:hypothetical protein